MALSFDATLGYVRVADLGSHLNTGEITVEFWQRAHAVRKQETFALDSPPSSGRMLAHVPYDDGVVYWDFGDITKGGRLSYKPTVPIIGSWQHFALVAKVGSGGYMRIYRNGVLEAQGGAAAFYTSGPYDLILGGLGTKFDGELDEFRVWNVARSEEDVWRNMKVRLGGSEPGLVAYYHMDEGAGKKLGDSSPYAHHGALVNNTLWVPRSSVGLGSKADLQFGLSRYTDNTATGTGDGGSGPGVGMNDPGTVFAIHQSGDNVRCRVGRTWQATVNWQPRSTLAEGDDPACALNNKNVVVAMWTYDEGLLSLGKHVLRSRIGKINADNTVTWGQRQDVDEWCSEPTVAINDAGTVVEVHESQSSLTDDMWYRVGTANGTSSISWGGSAWYSNGRNPAVAINNAGRVVEVHNSPIGWKLWYRVGQVNGNKIKWGSNVHYDSGLDPSVALRDDGTVIEAHESEGKDTLWLRVGKINGSKIDWAQKNINFSDGEAVSVACNSRSAIQLHVDSDDRLTYSTSLITDRSRWMEERLHALYDRPLSQLALPHSHDAGMYGLNGVRITGSGNVAGMSFSFTDMRADQLRPPGVPAYLLGAVTGLIEPLIRAFAARLSLTQDLSIYDQLRAGSRHFDLRPKKSGNALRLHHSQERLNKGFDVTVPVIKKKLALNLADFSADGPSLGTVLSDVARFMREGHRELVVLELTHYYSPGGKFDSQTYLAMAQEINARLGPWLYTTNALPPGKVLGEVTLGEFLPTSGKGVVLVLCERINKNAPNPPANGTWALPDDMVWPGKYKETAESWEENFDVQKNAFYEQESNFAWGWNLTVQPPYLDSVASLTDEANPHLGWALANCSIPNATGCIINRVGVDFFEDSRAADVAVYLNGAADIGAPPPMAPSVILTQPQDQLVGVGSNATFRVKVKPGIARLTYQWRFNGVKIPGATRSAYTVQRAALTNAGGYSVVVEASRAWLVSQTAELTVRDLTLPIVALTSPVAGTVFKVPTATLRGTARDNVALGHVMYKLNNDTWWRSVQGTTSWSATAPLLPGTNLITVVAVDTAGLESKPVTRKVIYEVYAPLALQIEGQGAVTPNLDGRMLKVGRTYALLATARAGYVLDGWYRGGSSLRWSEASTLRFQMEEGLSLAAKFVPNPFLPVRGSYAGLLAAEPQAQENSGSLTLTLSGSGSYSASLRLAGKQYPFTGRFNVDGYSAMQLKPKGQSPVDIVLSLDGSGAVQTIAGTVSRPTWGYSAEALAFRKSFHSTNPAPYAGRHTWVNTGFSDPAFQRIPWDYGLSYCGSGDGYGTIVLSANGLLTLQGRLADNQPLSVASVLVPAMVGDPPVPGYAAPIYAPLYGGQGAFWTWLQFTNPPAAGLTGGAFWSKAAMPTGGLYPAGFTNHCEVLGSVYHRPAVNERVVALTNFVAIFSGPPHCLETPFVSPLRLESNNRVTNLGTNKLVLTLSTSTGLFSGWVGDPVGGKTLTCKGVLVQGLNGGSGLCLLPTYSSAPHQTGYVGLGSE